MRLELRLVSSGSSKLKTLVVKLASLGRRGRSGGDVTLPGLLRCLGRMGVDVDDRIDGFTRWDGRLARWLGLDGGGRHCLPSLYCKIGFWLTNQPAGLTIRTHERSNSFEAERVGIVADCGGGTIGLRIGQ